MIGDVLDLDTSLLHINLPNEPQGGESYLVADEDNGNVLADTLQITVPVGNVLVGLTGSDIEHDDGAVGLNVVTITKSTELLLTGGIPDVEDDGTAGSVELDLVDFSTTSG